MLTTGLLAATVLAAAAAPEVPPLRVVWDAQPTPDLAPTLDWLEQRGWCWGIDVRQDTDRETLETLRDRGWRAVMHLHAHPETAHNDWSYKRRNQEIPPQDFDGSIARLVGVFGREAVAEFFLEDDSSGVGFSGRYLREKPAAHAEAMRMFDAYLQEAMARVRRHPEVAVWGLNGYAPSAHAFVRNGVRNIICERTNDDVEDLSSAFAFNRGAATQYGAEWGVDTSLWWGAFYGCVHELDASLYTRHLWLSWFAGARTFRIEGGAFLLGDPADPLPVARAVDEFASKARVTDPGRPDVPVALLMAEDHGWMTPPYWRTTNTAWNYARIPYRQGQRGIDGFFGRAFPGAVYAMDPFPFGAYAKDDPPASPYALSCVTPDFAPTPAEEYYAEPPIPFGRFETRDAARAAISGQRMDPSPYRPMNDTRWGDIFDVFTSPVSLEILMEYPVLVVIGQVRPDPALREKLNAYVAGGGSLVWAAGVASPDDATFCGAAIAPELRVGRAWQWEGGAPVHEAFRYLPAKPETGARALASAPNGDPLVIARKLGAGMVYTCLIPWFEAGHTPLAGPAARLFDEVIGGVQPVRVEGLPAQWLSTRHEEHRTLVVSNNSGEPWRGTASVAGVDPAFGRCEELRSGAPVAFSREREGVRVTLEVPAYDVVVVRWSR